jgi:hypothetical protein
VKAEAILTDCEWFHDDAVEEGVSILRPNGQYVGVRAGDDGPESSDESDDEVVIEENVGEIEEDLDEFEDLLSTTGVSVSRYVTLDDGETMCHKASVIREVNANCCKKVSTDRLRRVRGVAASPYYGTEDESETFIVGDPCGVLVQNVVGVDSRQRCLAVVLVEEIIDEAVTGRIMELKPLSGQDKDVFIWTKCLDPRPFKTAIYQCLDCSYDVQKKELVFSKEVLKLFRSSENVR